MPSLVQKIMKPYPTTTLWDTPCMTKCEILDAFEGDHKSKALRKSPPQVVDFFVILICHLLLYT
jgi:hypothetical protein